MGKDVDYDAVHQKQKARWAALQERLAAQVEVPVEGGYEPQEGDITLGLDIQYEGDTAYVAGALSRWGGEQLGTYAGHFAITAPYISGYFCFREGPPVLALLAALARAGCPAPQLLVVDGHGIAHPRRFGAACWVGVATGIPTIGCAKDTLLRYEGVLDGPRGSDIPVLRDDEVVGHVLRRIADVRPVYVSPGHKVSLEATRQIGLALPSKYRVPDPIRWADRAARELSKGQQSSDWEPLGALPETPAPWEESAAT